MFERFTERARKVVVLAQDEARHFNHNYIGTEHLLLGLLREDEGVAAQALSSLNVTLDEVREQVQSIVGYGEEGTGAQAPFTPRSKKVLELALKESSQLRHNYIGTEHLLLGLVRESEGVAARVLSNLEVDPDKVRREVVRRLGGGRQRSSGGEPGPRVRSDPGRLSWTREALRRSFGRHSREDRPSFDKFTERFTERARKVVVVAQDEARLFNHNYIGTEHLLLGLLQERDGVAARALNRVGVTPDVARTQVEYIVGYGEEITEGQLPFTPRANKVLRFAEREALQLGHDHISTEHILLGLVRESEGVAARVLLNLGVDPDAVRREVIRRLHGRGWERDSLDEIEREMEEEEGAGRKLFRGRVVGVRTELALPRPLNVSIDVDYVYRAPVGSAGGPTIVEPGDVADLIRDELVETEARSLETVITTLGEGLLDTFRAVLEVTVTVSGVPEPADPPAATFSLSATFRR